MEKQKEKIFGQGRGLSRHVFAAIQKHADFLAVRGVAGWGVLAMNFVGS